MRAVVQRVQSCSVVIDNAQHASIGPGLMVLLGVTHTDTVEDAAWLAQKILSCRIFSDDHGKMNRAIQEVRGQLMVVSQFTLFASTQKGNRPSYTEAAKPDVAKLLYESFKTHCETLLGQTVYSGVFGADMQVSLVNDGPVTLLFDSHCR